MKKWPVYDENGCIPRTPREELPQTFEVDGQTLSLEEIERRFAGQINNVIEEEESFEAGHDELSRLFWQYEKLDMECTEEVILHILQPLVDSKDTRGFARADHRLRCSDFQRESTRAVKRMIIEGDDPQKVFLLKQWHGPELWGELYKDESTKDEARKALKAFLESYGLNPHTAAKSWVQAINEGKYKSENIITKEQVAR
ncbi:MAG TPA: hypothetical protein VIT68_00470, partial [Candidatus Gracilibacteria bacterium]